MALVLRGVPDISRYGAARLTDGLLTAFNEKTAIPGRARSTAVCT